ncbi:MAG: hypothetical protein AB1938_29240 [Myxococcota bacterium]
MTLWILAAVLLSAEPPKSIYTYTDADGTVCFTDDLSTVPKHLRSPPKETTGGALSVLSPQRPFPLPEVLEADWRDDVPECRTALATVRAAQGDLEKGEAELNRRVTAFAPCQRFLDVCYHPRLTRETWETSCRAVPPACDVNVKEMNEYVLTLRERVDALVAWLRKMAEWRCVRGV